MRQLASCAAQRYDDGADVGDAVLTKEAVRAEVAVKQLACLMNQGSPRAVVKQRAFIDTIRGATEMRPPPHYHPR